MADAPDSLTVESFGRKLRAGEVTAQAITEQCLHRIEADNSRLNAFIRVMADEARAQAAAADRELAAGIDRGPLHGVPISIKDLIDIRGVPTTAASRVRDGHIAERDAPAVAHLRQAGAVFDRQDQPARVCVRHDQRGLRLRTGPQPSRPVAIARRLERRVGDQRGDRDGPRHRRHRHRRIDSHPRRRLRHRRPQAELRRGLHRSGRAAVPDAGSRRSARALRHRRVAGLPRAARRTTPSPRTWRPGSSVRPAPAGTSQDESSCRFQSAACDSPSHAPTSASCWTTRSDRVSKRR